MEVKSGYSLRPLVEKLGIKENSRVWIINPPQNYPEILGELPPGVSMVENLEPALLFIHFFSKSREEVEDRLPGLKEALAFNGALWISWPKRSSKIGTDLNETLVREIGLASGLVDVKVCAIDQIWSGLKFIYRFKDRPR